MSTKLNQIIAVESGLKTRAQDELTKLHQIAQKPALFAGLSRAYQPRAEDGQALPAETQIVQVKVEDLLRAAEQILSRLYDVTATRDYANCAALADVVVDGKPLIKDVPVTYLLFLEKKLIDLHTFLKKLPVLDASEVWRFSNEQNLYATEPAASIRTQKVPRVIVKYDATPEHPAQVEMFMEDQPVGAWTQVRYSGAAPAATIEELVARVEKVQQAVKFAREQANNIEVTAVRIAKPLFDFVLRGVVE